MSFPNSSPNTPGIQTPTGTASAGVFPQSIDTFNGQDTLLIAPTRAARVAIGNSSYGLYETQHNGMINTNKLVGAFTTVYNANAGNNIFAEMDSKGVITGINSSFASDMATDGVLLWEDGHTTLIGTYTSATSLIKFPNDGIAAPRARQRFKIYYRGCYMDAASGIIGGTYVRGTLPDLNNVTIGSLDDAIPSLQVNQSTVSSSVIAKFREGPTDTTDDIVTISGDAGDANLIVRGTTYLYINPATGTGAGGLPALSVVGSGNPSPGTASLVVYPGGSGPSNILKIFSVDTERSVILNGGLKITYPSDPTYYPDVYPFNLVVPSAYTLSDNVIQVESGDPGSVVFGVQAMGAVTATQGILGHTFAENIISAVPNWCVNVRVAPAAPFVAGGGGTLAWCSSNIFFSTAGVPPCSIFNTALAADHWIELTVDFGESMKVGTYELTYDPVVWKGTGNDAMDVYVFWGGIPTSQAIDTFSISTGETTTDEFGFITRKKRLVLDYATKSNPDFDTGALAGKLTIRWALNAVVDTDHFVAIHGNVNVTRIC